MLATGSTLSCSRYADQTRLIVVRGKVRRDDEIAPFTVAIAHESPAVSSLIREIGSFAIEIERLAQPVNAKHDCRLSIVKHGRYKSRIAYWNSYK